MREVAGEESESHSEDAADVVELDRSTLDKVCVLDAELLGADRSPFVRRWLGVSGIRPAALVRESRLSAFAALHPAQVGYKIGPVYADDASDAERVIAHLMASVEGEVVQLDVPETNESGVAIARAAGLAEAFGCARMYLGGVPRVDTDRIFGVSSFEFG